MRNLILTNQSIYQYISILQKVAYKSTAVLVLLYNLINDNIFVCIQNNEVISPFSEGNLDVDVYEFFITAQKTINYSPRIRLNPVIRK